MTISNVKSSAIYKAFYLLYFHPYLLVSYVYRARDALFKSAISKDEGEYELFTVSLGHPKLDHLM